ncbi:nucleotidyltransferase domain-containing protein [Amycolatopsis sp. NPDC004378]
MPWWLAGGFALELAAGRSWRPHGDVDVLVPRRDQLGVQRALAGWEWWAADPPGTLRPGAAGELLGPAVHDVWCRPSAGAARLRSSASQARFPVCGPRSRCSPRRRTRERRTKRTSGSDRRHVLATPSVAVPALTPLRTGPAQARTR